MQQDDNNEIPEATSQAMPDDIPEMLLGPPFAIAGDVELIEQVQGSPGCAAVVRCESETEAGTCGQVFRINLTKEGAKVCPNCRAEYTHALIIGRTDDTDLVADAMSQVLAANGYQLNDDDEGDDDDDDQGDEIADADQGGGGEGNG